MKLSTLILCLLLASPVGANDHIVIVEDAFAALSRDFHEEWAFTHVTTEDDIEHVGRYDPRRVDGERWQLVSVNGLLPTVDDIADYRRDMAHEFDDENDSSDGEIVDYESLVLIEETPQLLVYSFLPNFEVDGDDAGAKMMRSVVGTLSIARDGNYVQSIELRNERSVRPIIGVKIKHFVTLLQFGPADGVGPIVPLSVDVEVKGRAAMVVKIEEGESVQFRDYEWVAANTLQR